MNRIAGWLPWRQDGIARRSAITIMLAFAATLLLNFLFVTFAGVWGLPSLIESGLLQTAAATLRIAAAEPPERRAAMAEAASGPDYRVEWFTGPNPVPRGVHDDNDLPEAMPLLRRELGDLLGRVFFFSSNSPEFIDTRFEHAQADGQTSYYMVAELPDASWLIFSVPERRWGMTSRQRGTLRLGFAIISILLATALTTRSIAAPIERLAAAVRRFGSDPAAPPIQPAGPAELRELIGAFNAMQARIGRFVQDRTSMLAAISHDLRTPLTRIRLRAELIAAPKEREKLFRDVSEMQTMIESALAFFRDDARHEPGTSFDLAELLKSSIDDFGDQGIAVAYTGPAHLTYRGRPMALRRVVVNLIDNAVKYASDPGIHLELTPDSVLIDVEDHGPGIPPEAREQVFAPFYRLESSRSRATGGVGLGLTAARSIVRAHGGELSLETRSGGGMTARVILPIARTEATAERARGISDNPTTD